MQSSLDPSLANKRRRVPIKITEPTSTVVSTTSSVVPVPGPSKPQASRVLELSSQATPAPLNAGTDPLEPVSSRSLKDPATDASLGHGKAPLTTKKSLGGNSSSKVQATDAHVPPAAASPVPLPENLLKSNTFKDAKQARESAKPSRVGGGIFRASGSNTIFTPRNNGDPTLADPESSTSSSSVGPSAKDNSKIPYMPVPKAPNTLFDFVKSWGSLRSTEDKWQLIIVSIFKVKIHPIHRPNSSFRCVYRVFLPRTSQYCVKRLSNLLCLYLSWRPSLLCWMLRKTTLELKPPFESIWRILQVYLGLVL